MLMYITVICSQKISALLEFEPRSAVQRESKKIVNMFMFKRPLVGMLSGYDHELVAGVSWAQALLPLKTQGVDEAISPADVVFRKEWCQRRCPPRHSTEELPTGANGSGKCNFCCDITMCMMLCGDRKYPSLPAEASSEAVAAQEKAQKDFIKDDSLAQLILVGHMDDSNAELTAI
ncbi:hypothetical protein TNCV_5009831 [Trichonephila clavipes]|nr:hypothetical protein TNCV_5009831 [Trichonephila clavipes]